MAELKIHNHKFEFTKTNGNYKDQDRTANGLLGIYTKKTQVYRHNVFTTWNRLLSDDDTAADAAARSFVVSGCKAGCERPELCYNDGGIYTV